MDVHGSNHFNSFIQKFVEFSSLIPKPKSKIDKKQIGKYPSSKQASNHNYGQ
jgi:hypothetical protein